MTPGTVDSSDYQNTRKLMNPTNNSNYDYVFKSDNANKLRLRASAEPRVLDYMSKNSQNVKEIKNINLEKTQLAVDNIYE